MMIKTHVVIIERNGKIIRCVGPFSKPDALKCKRELLQETKKEWWSKHHYKFRVINCWPNLDGPATDFAQRMGEPNA
jgi:hypothetical protein